MQLLAGNLITASGECLYLKSAENANKHNNLQLNQFTNKQLIAYYNRINKEEINHQNNLEGVFWFINTKRSRKHLASCILNFYTDPLQDTFTTTTVSHNPKVHQLKQMIHNYLVTNTNGHKRNAPAYNMQIVILWLITLLMPAYILLLAFNIVELCSTASLIFVAGYSVLTLTLIIINACRR